ncbi:MAG: TetR/AcrR family transcriptional regulator [Pseudomonadota bacterium]|nr:TetR/AcrR family transcriptional regulator [Pseudomonadota bacterium]
MLAETLSSEKRAQILAGAAAVFASDGYEGASMSRIAAEAGVSKGTLYNHFPSKAALFAAYVERQCERNLWPIFDGLDHAGDPAAVLRGIGLRMVQLFMSPIGVTIYRVVASEAAKFPELARTFYASGPEQAIRHLAGWLAEETRRGRLTVPDAEFAADQFLALCQTRLGLRRRLLLLDEAPPDEVERVVDASVAMFLRMYGGAPGFDADGPARLPVSDGLV